MATRSYTLGKGKLLFKPDDTSVSPAVEGQSYKDLGNAPEFGITLETEKLEHYSSRSGLQLKDASIITQTSLTGTFTLDEPNDENLALFLMSNEPYSYSQSDSGALVGTVSGEGQAAGTLKIDRLGDWVPLYHNGASDASVINEGVAGGGAVHDPANSATGDVDYDVTDATADETDAGVWEIMVSEADTIDQVIVRKNGEAWAAEQAMDAAVEFGTSSATAIGVNFTTTTGHALGDTWRVTVLAIDATGSRVFKVKDSGTAANDITVKSSGGATTYVEGDDGVGNYMVDRVAGIVYINPDQSGATDAIPDPAGTPLVLDITVWWLANSESAHADAFTLSALKGHLYFIGAPPVGQAMDIQGYVSLTPTGDLSMIGEDWTQFQFEAEYLEHSRYKDESELQGLARVTNRTQIG